MSSVQNTQITSQLLQGDLVDERRKMTPSWYIYFRDKGLQANQGPLRIGSPVALANQNASIGVTSVTSEALTAGLYRITYYARITSAAGVSSSLTVNLAWDDGIVSCSKTFTAITGNTISTTGSESYMVRIDTPPITYSVTYASVPASAMQYSLDIVVEAVAVTT